MSLHSHLRIMLMIGRRGWTMASAAHAAPATTSQKCSEPVKNLKHIESTHQVCTSKHTTQACKCSSSLWRLQTMTTF